MQSKKKGVASFILEKAHQVVVIHCSSHNLNSALAKPAKIQIIDNTLEQLRAIQIFFNTSPKRDSLLEYIVKIRRNTSSRNLVMPDMLKALEVMIGVHSSISSFDRICTTVGDV